MAGTYDEGPFEFAIRHGNAIFTWPSGDKHIMPLAIARICHARVDRVLREHDARGQVCEFRKLDD